MASARVEAAQRAAAAAASSRTANSVFSIQFDFGATQAVVPSEVAIAMLNSAKDAPLIFVRGRTDGNTDSPVESRIARDRAASVRDYLVAAGVPAARIRTTYQPAGDTVGENNTEGGRRANRRAEVEIYRTVPVAMGGVSSH